MKATNNILVSIVIPVYNSEKTIGKCLDSLVEQTHKDIEIICVNDCSKDNSLAVLEQYATKDKRIIIINHKENKNAGGARNSGIRAAKGEYLCFVDNDDWLRADAIELLLKASDNAEYDVVACQWAMVDSEGKETTMSNYVVGPNREASIEHMFFHGGGILGTLFRRNMIMDHKLFYPEKLFWEDNAIHASFIIMSKTMMVIPDILYYYYVGSQCSSSRSFSYQKVVDRIKSSDIFLENAKNQGYYNQYQEEINWSYLYRFITTLDFIINLPYMQALHLLPNVERRIRPYLSNVYFNRFEVNEQKKLLHPRKYIISALMRRVRSDYRKHLHSMRHSIAVVYKKIFNVSNDG